MGTSGLTIGDIAPFIEFAKSNVLGINVTDFGVLFDRIEELLRATNQWTAELAAQLQIAEEQLTANPDLFQIGKAEFIQSVDALLAKYPPETLLSDIPEFQGTIPPPGGEGSIPPIVDGDGGIQIAVLDALYNSVTVDFDPSTNVITLNGLGVEITTLSDVERLQFLDGMLAFDFDGVAGQAYRLYEAVFDRAPDAEGLGFWIGSLDAGVVDLKAAADHFVQSAEFIQRYGSPDQVSNAGFIDLLYLNILDRPAEGEGFDFWLANMDAGKVDRADVLAHFSESPENVAQVAGAIAEGIWYV